MEDYDFALERRRFKATRELLADIRDDVVRAYQEYESGGGCPATVKALDADDLAKEALRGNYDLTYPKKPLSGLRSDLLASAFHGLCPMCGEGRVAALDHYLPKESYPEFSVLAANLVPACSDCNRRKGAFIAADDGGRFFHPYFDDLSEAAPILGAKVNIDSDGLVVDFDVNRQLPQDLYVNAVVQFEKLQLGGLYSWAASEEIIQRHDSFFEAYQDAGADGVADTARQHSKSLRRTYGNQYWKSALYLGLADSSDFCDGGFELPMAS